MAVAGCAPTAHTADEPPPGVELARPIEALRIRLAGNPGDPGLNLALARALERAGRPGGAIRHYEGVLRHRALGEADRAILARLYVDRARARLALGDGDAWRDLDRASGQGGQVPGELEREALFAGALAALRHGDRPGRETARQLMKRAGKGDDRLAALDPERAALPAVAVAGAWLADGGARRAALEVYEVYVARGGRAPEHARRYLALHRWWYGDRERPSGLVLRELAEGGLDLCAVSPGLDPAGCRARSGAALDPAGWPAVLRAARAQDPDGPREAELCERAPAFACAAHLRESGALGALAARAPSPALDAALARWTAALDHPRLSAGRDAVLARWRRLAATAPVRSPVRDVLPLGTVDVHRLSGDRATAAALERIARAYLRSPASAERLAEDFADGAPAIGQRGPSIAALFLALGDPARAWQWAEAVSRSSPQHAPYAMAAGAVSVAAGAVDRADVFFTQAAQSSGDAGATSVAASRLFLAHGFPLPALAAARRALQLTAGGQPEHQEAARLAARAMDLLGRTAESRRLLTEERIPPETPAAPLAFPPVDTAAWRAAIADTLARALLAPKDEAARLFTALADELDAAGIHTLAAACRREALSVAL